MYQGMGYLTFSCSMCTLVTCLIFSKYYNGIKTLTQTLWHDMTWPWPEIENLTSEMDSAYLKIHKKTFYTSILGKWLESSFSKWVNYESCPKFPSWQKSWICSRTPLDYESPIFLHRIELSRFRKCQIDYKYKEFYSLTMD